MPSAFVGFDPDEVDRLVRLLTGASEDILRLAARAQGALDRAAPVTSVTDAQYDVDSLRAVGFHVASMRDTAGQRLAKFRADQALEQAATWGERALGGVSEAAERALGNAERWMPGRWVRGEWIPGGWVLEHRALRLVGEGVEIEAHSVRAVKTAGRFGPRSWVEGEMVPDEALRTGGKWLGRSMNALDVGLAGWDEWGARSDLSGAERAAHAGLAGATVGVGSAFGGAYGYAIGAAAATALVAAAPIAVPVAAVAVVGGMVGAVVGSELGAAAGGFVKERVKDIGGAVAGGARKAAKKIFGMFS